MSKTNGKYRWAWARLQEGETVYPAGGYAALRLMRGAIYHKSRGSTTSNHWIPWHKFGDNELDEFRRAYDFNGGGLFYLTAIKAVEATK